MPRDGVLQEDTWRQTLLQLDLDPDDPESWLKFLSLSTNPPKSPLSTSLKLLNAFIRYNVLSPNLTPDNV